MASSSSSPSPPQRTATAAGRQSPFFRDLASPIPPRRSSRFAPTVASSSTPPPPTFTLDDRFYADDFSPGPTTSGILPVAASPSPRTSAADRSPSWDRSRGRASASVSPMDGVVEPAHKEVLALPPRSLLHPPRAATAEVRSPVTPAPAPSRTASAASGTGVDGEEWVTVFGFSARETNLVLREFEKCGMILRHCSGPRDGNWIHILYQHHYDAQRALEKNGIQLISGVTIGVKITDPVHQRQVDEKMSGINHRGFMVSLLSRPFVLKSAGASSQLGDFPRSYDPKAGTNAIRDAGCCPTGGVTMPAKSVVTKAMDLIFGI